MELMHGETNLAVNKIENGSISHELTIMKVQKNAEYIMK
jgi:hypothetical protein